MGGLYPFTFLLLIARKWDWIDTLDQEVNSGVEATCRRALISLRSDKMIAPLSLECLSLKFHLKVEKNKSCLFLQ